MRKMKGSGNYLKSQVRKNLAKSVFCLFIFALLFFASSFEAVRTLRIGLLVDAGLLLSLVPLAGFFFYLHRYRVYSGGWEGEKQVAKLLSSRLSDDYILLNNLYLRNGGGDIDHVVLTPGGVFVLETKNWSGEIICNGDDWRRTGKGDFKASPSRQVKRNVANIKRIVEAEALRPLSVGVEGAIVFTNRHATLHLKSPTVLVLKLPQLPDQIIAQGNLRRYSAEQLELVGKEILKQKR